LDSSFRWDDSDPRLAMLDNSSAARVGAAFFSGLCGIHDRLEKVLWALRTRKRWLPVCDEKRHTVHTGNSRRLRVTDATARELAAWMELISPTNLAVVVEDFCGSQLVASDGIQRIHWGRVSEFWKTHKVPDPESKDATPQFNRPLARGIASHPEMQNAEVRPEI
jgi:hypothetical protein